MHVCVVQAGRATAAPAAIRCAMVVLQALLAKLHKQVTGVFYGMISGV